GFAPASAPGRFAAAVMAGALYDGVIGETALIPRKTSTHEGHRLETPPHRGPRSEDPLACCATRRSAYNVHLQDPCQPPVVGDGRLEQPCRSRPAAGRLPVAIP